MRSRSLGCNGSIFLRPYSTPTPPAARIRQLPEEGTVVYVMRTRMLDYLFFNYLYAKRPTPRPIRQWNRLTFYRGLGLWFRQKWRRLMGNDTPQPPALEQLRQRLMENILQSCL